MHTPARSLPAAALLAVTALLLGCPSEEKECSSGQTLCFGNCVDAQTDASACGQGCIPCSTGASCVAGACECPTGLTDCGGACVDTQTSAPHCGGCDQSCGLGTCSGAACGCDASATPCADLLWPRCVNTTSDASNCGSCRNVCPLTNDVCVASTCSCPGTLPDACPTACVSFQTDELHCGDCTTVCPTNATCTMGSCTCPAGTSVCGTGPGACVDRDNDENNCGTCGNVCPATASCTTGSCVCPGATPQACGTTVKTCCAGTGCCGDSCQTTHSNGLGQSFYDCNPLGTLTLASATAAANAWDIGTASFDMSATCGGGCYGRQTASACAVWCYSGSFTGKVSRNDINNACLCPPQAVVGDWN